MLTQRSVISELQRARQRGVNVRVMLEENPYEGARYAKLGYSLLQGAGIDVQWANERAFRYTHEKAMVVDDRVAGIFTFNLTSSGVYRNREFGVIDASGADARTLAGIFDADWSRHTVSVPSGSRLVVSPTNSRRDLQTLIDGAHSTLDLYQEEVADTSVESHLVSAERRHVRVRLITSTDSPGVETLRHGGISVSIMSSPYVHAKAIVADGARLFVGSENISGTSLDANREVGILLSDGGLAGEVERTFAADWRSRGGTPSSTVPPKTGPVKTGSGLRVRVTTTPAAVSRGQQLTITASTSPGASCTVRVTYPDGYVSRASSLQGSKTADSSGSVSWSWHVGSTASGTARVGVTCSLSGRTATGGTTFQIG
jgi:phosphatidylserine/phosphatidylglycerophosphate/cardiolipin synthase-like enzyme